MPTHHVDSQSRIFTALQDEPGLYRFLDDVLYASMAATHASRGSVQLLDDATGALRIVVQRGFEPGFLSFFGEVREDHAACGMALRERRRVLVDDVRRAPIFSEQARQVMVEAGSLACQSTPVVSGNTGAVLGVLSTHFSDAPHRVEPEQLEAIDRFAECLGDYLDRSRSWLDLERELQRERDARARLEAEGHDKDRLLAVIGHELRQPLSAAMTAVVLQGRGDPQQAARARTVLDRQLRHMALLVDDLLETSRIERGALVLRTAPVDLWQVVREAAEIVQALTEEKRHRIELDGPSEAIWITADADRLRQVFSNLLKNAAQHTPPRGRIGVRLELQGSSVRATVRDSGPGLPPGELERIFDPFTQLNGASAAGFGIGLAVVRHLVELHGGEVRAWSAGRGQGSEFTVTLPLAIAPRMAS